MHCYDYQAAEPMRSCCATTIGEFHGPDCNRRRELAMTALADERVRVGRLRRADVADNWRPADRLVTDISMWDAAPDPDATVTLADATGYDGDEELEAELAPDPELEAFVSRIRTTAWLVLLVPLLGCGAFQAGERFAAHLPLSTSPAAAWGQIATVILGVFFIGAVLEDLVGPGAAATR